jgi:hypothetical protein
MILMVIAFAAATLFWAIVEFGAIVCFYGFIGRRADHAVPEVSSHRAHQ